MLLSPKGGYRQRIVTVDSFEPNPWGLIMCTETYMNGRRVAGTIAIAATLAMVVRGLRAIVVAVSSAGPIRLRRQCAMN